MTKALGFRSNLELDPRSRRTRVGPKISNVTVVKDGTKVEKWYVNYFTQFDSILYGCSLIGGWTLVPIWPFDAGIFKGLVNQFGPFLESQQTLYDNYLDLRAGPFKSAVNQLDQFFYKYQYGISVRSKFHHVLKVEEKSPGFSDDDLTRNELMEKEGEGASYALQRFLNNNREEMNNHSLYTDEYLETFHLMGWGTSKAKNHLILEPDRNAIKLAKQLGL